MWSAEGAEEAGADRGGGLESSGTDLVRGRHSRRRWSRQQRRPRPGPWPDSSKAGPHSPAGEAGTAPQGEPVCRQRGQGHCQVQAGRKGGARRAARRGGWLAGPFGGRGKGGRGGRWWWRGRSRRKGGARAGRCVRRDACWRGPERRARDMRGEEDHTEMEVRAAAAPPPPPPRRRSSPPPPGRRTGRRTRAAGRGGGEGQRTDGARGGGRRRWTEGAKQARARGCFRPPHPVR